MIEIPTVAPPALNRPPDLCCKIKLGGGGGLNLDWHYIIVKMLRLECDIAYYTVSAISRKSIQRQKHRLMHAHMLAMTHKHIHMHAQHTLITNDFENNFVFSLITTIPVSVSQRSKCNVCSFPLGNQEGAAVSHSQWRKCCTFFFLFMKIISFIKIFL